ncbi:carboxypeptidase-like regulatory domain-containing protein, partial [Flavobacterium sp.]|uniref:carboxypeptidase-like regulatory domain-containing protein n=1 Tax=Flavobacterium sp. TaxID=239 RepID=UPI0037BFD0F1
METLKFTLTIVILFFVNITFSQDKNVKIVSKKNDPLIVVVNDSILKYEVIEYINPNDIESVTVWKDAKAISLYGDKGKFGVIAITTKNLSKRKLRKIYKEYSLENVQKNETEIFKISGIVYDYGKLAIPGAYIKNLNSNAIAQTDFDGKFSIEVKINDVLEISFIQFESQKVKIKNKENLVINLKVEHQIMVEKPVIYLYPKEKTTIDIKLNLKGKLLTTFPKYDKNWEVIAEPNGQIFDKKTNRYYNSLFWDGTIEFPKEHYEYNDGFVVPKEKLAEFLIEKLEYVGLNNQETNEFIQYWLPILERNKYNFIHFLVNEKCN